MDKPFWEQATFNTGNKYSRHTIFFITNVVKGAIKLNFRASDHTKSLERNIHKYVQLWFSHMLTYIIFFCQNVFKGDKLSFTYAI